jgi:hypothetical protein
MAAQSFLNLDVAQNFSTFKFSYNPIISDNTTSSAKPEYSQISTTAFGVGYSYFHKSGAFATGGLGFRKAGASLVYKKTNYLWNLQYFDIKAGIGYQYNKWRIRPYASVIPYYAYLMNAKQSIGQNYYDIKAENALKAYDFGLLLNLGLNIKMTQYLALCAEYGYNLGLKNIEPEEDQYLYNRGFLIKLGLSISINNLKTIQEPVPLQNQQVQTNDAGAGNFQPAQFQLAGAKNNSSSAKNNTDESATNSVSATETSQNNDEQKIQSPGTIGWTRSTPTSTPKTKNVLTGSSSDNNLNEDINTPETVNSNNSSNNSTLANNSSGTAKSTETQSSTGNQTASSGTNETKRSQPVDAKSANSSSNATYGAVPVTPDKNNPGSEMNIPIIEASQNTKKTSSDDKIVFKVQLTAVKNPLGNEHPILQNIKGEIRAEKGRDGWLRYYLGSYKTYEAAYKELKKIKTKGLAEGGFIVAFKNGKKITVAEAKELLK